MTEQDQLEKSARVCDGMAAELEAQRPNAKRAQFPKQAEKEIDYAIRAMRRAAERIRALKDVGVESVAMPEGGSKKLQRAIALARDLRPIIEKTRGSKWKTDMLRRLDDLISDDKPGQ